MANSLPLTRRGDIVSSCDIVLDPDPTRSTVEQDALMVEMEHVLSPVETTSMSRHVVRLELSQDVMRQRHMTPPMIRRILRDRLQGSANVISSEVNDVEWVVRVRFHHVSDMIEKGHLRSEQEGLICQRT